MDFTIAKFEKLCLAICESKYKNVTFEEYFTNPNLKASNCIILRHDVDKDSEHALNLALIEKRFGLKATYYFRVKENLYTPTIIRKIADCEHEIGYHYETVDKCSGHVDQAARLFGDELALIREQFRVNTACMHGNPLTKYDNKEIWKVSRLSDFDLIGEPYISLDYDKFSYFSESGRTWRTKTWKKTKDVIPNRLDAADPRNTDELITMISQGRLDNICLLTHPERWTKTIPDYSTRYLVDTAYILGKFAINIRNLTLGKI